MPSLLYSHIPKNLLLILLSLVFLPFNTFILAFAYLIRPLLTDLHCKNDDRTSSRGQTILITGVSMTKALTLTRLLRLHSPHHRIIGADFHPLASGRVSRSLTRFLVLAAPTPADPSPYISSLLSIVAAEHVTLWISCSGVASAVEDGVAAEIVAAREPSCRVVQFGVNDTRTLHEKDSFMQRTRALGLRVPETRTVRSEEEMIAALRQCVGLSDRSKGRSDGGRKFIAKSIAMDDKSRGDLTLLPFSTEKETRAHVARLGVSAERPWIVQEFVRGREYCTHALVVRGEVRAFVACPSAELLMHYQALPAASSLSLAMLEFTKRQAEAGGKRFTGHLSFDFLVNEDAIDKTEPESIALYPIECNPRAHTADVLFNDTMRLADEYLSVLQETRRSVNGAGSNGEHKTSPDGKNIVVPEHPARYYWIGHDLVQLLLLPMLSLLTGQASIGETWRSVREFVQHVLFWKDGSFELWDPLPWWWLYHVYWPSQFVNRIQTGRKWSRMNVSTTKMFDCE